MRDERVKVLGFNIKVERLRKKITQSKLAEMANISTNTLLNLEGGKQTPSCLVLYDIAKALEVSLDTFYEGM